MKPFVTVTMTLHGDVEKEVSDYVDNGGKFVPLGTEVLAMLEQHKILHYKDASGVETIIPFDSVMTYNTTKESQEYTKPEDDFCKAEETVNPDCNHPELGELMYCGSASNKVIVSDSGGCDEGVSEDYCDTEVWNHNMGCNGMVGVFDGNIVPARESDEISVTFGTYLTVERQVDPDTGDNLISVSALTGAEHYAIYYCEDCDHCMRDAGYLYYCGGLRNGDIINGDTHDVGAIETDGGHWADAITYGNLFTRTMVACGETIVGQNTSETTMAFGETSLVKDVNAETGDTIITITNAPSHYAIYVKEN